MIAGTSAPLPNYRLPRTLRFSSACSCPLSHPAAPIPHDFSLTLSLSSSLSSSRPLSFWSELARASTRASPREASSRAIPVITTTSIFVKSLSPLSLPPSSPFLPANASPRSFDLPLYKSGRRTKIGSRRRHLVRYFPNYKFLRVPRPSISRNDLSFSTGVSPILPPRDTVSQIGFVRLHALGRKRGDARRIRRDESDILVYVYSWVLKCFARLYNINFVRNILYTVINLPFRFNNDLFDRKN